ncbi:MAG: NAD(P)-dependent oxidoreductase [Proteobacteria bacterium]|nr:NAD(P)-dependent oxidoreductase [Pseudomonadota bacterium]
MKTGFIGLGAMGLPMATNLQRYGLLHGVWNRSAEKAAAFAREHGCLHAQTPAVLAAECDAIVLCVSADADVMALCRQLAGSLRAGALVIDCSTVAAATAREAAALLKKNAAGFLDCPVSGGTEGAIDGTLAIMVGGEESDFQRALPVLEAMGGKIVHMGPSGAGQASKASNQIMVAGINQAVTEAMAFAKSQGLPLDGLIDLLGAGAAGCWFLSHRGPNMVKNEYPLGFKVELHLKDLAICRDMAASKGTRLPLVEMTMHHYQRLLDDGYRDEDISSLFRIKERMFAGDGKKDGRQ